MEAYLSSDNNNFGNRRIKIIATDPRGQIYTSEGMYRATISIGKNYSIKVSYKYNSPEYGIWNKAFKFNVDTEGNAGNCVPTAAY